MKKSFQARLDEGLALKRVIDYLFTLTQDGHLLNVEALKPKELRDAVRSYQALGAKFGNKVLLQAYRGGVRLEDHFIVCLIPERNKS